MFVNIIHCCLNLNIWWIYYLRHQFAHSRRAPECSCEYVTAIWSIKMLLILRLDKYLKASKLWGCTRAKLCNYSYVISCLFLSPISLSSCFISFALHQKRCDQVQRVSNFSCFTSGCSLLDVCVCVVVTLLSFIFIISYLKSSWILWKCDEQNACQLMPTFWGVSSIKGTEQASSRSHTECAFLAEKFLLMWKIWLDSKEKL